MPPPASPVRAPPRQTRSARTQDRILQAAEALLARGEPFTMDDLAERAHVSIGAIYKRLQGKTSLLPLVMERVQRQQSQRVQELLDDPRWREAGLASRITALLQGFAQTQVTRRHLIRALVIGHAHAPDGGATEARSAQLQGAILAWLLQCRDEIVHPQPALALSLGMFAAMQALQTAILFDRLPPALGVDTLVAEIARMYQRYLGLDTAA
jgi:AcrR family transcriptional regulator